MPGEKEIIGQSSSLREVFSTLNKVAPSDTTVLVTGESGTGKELLVRALHKKSARHDKPFVPINCGAIPKELLESELFGHEKGAFTHAIRSRPGRFELADGGTVFLDEIGEMDLLLQVKILRVLQEREIERVGGLSAKKVDVRIIAATNRNLEEEVAAGRFREDLFYRLNVIPLHLPPLREREKDVFLLMDFFLEKFCKNKKRQKLRLSSLVERILQAYTWPGNIRELENLAERLSILCDGNTVIVEDLPEKIAALAEELGHIEPVTTVTQTTSAPQGFVWPSIQDMQERGFVLKEFLETIEDKLLLEALGMTDGVKNQAAEVLGIKRTTLIEKIKKRGLE